VPLENTQTAEAFRQMAGNRSLTGKVAILRRLLASQPSAPKNAINIVVVVNLHSAEGHIKANRRSGGIRLGNRREP